jgi:hypothetical protein
MGIDLVAAAEFLPAIFETPYRYLKEKYGVISGSETQAQNGNDARWNSEEIFAPLCAFFNYKTAGLQA